MMIDLVFSIRGETIPTDHSYALYSCLSRILPILHSQEASIRFNPISGVYEQPGVLRLLPQSRLRLRLMVDDIKLILPLSGRSLDLNGHHLRLGVPWLHGLEPRTALIARMVTFKNSTTLETFLTNARKFLDARNFQGEVGVPKRVDQEGKEHPLRRVMRIKDKTIVGYSLIVSGLSAEESLDLQENGLGGRTKMGCGFFVPVSPRG
jgi:CRISPR-associated protein Cas6